MKISLITATYNSADTIRDCLYSVVCQDYPDLEHIVVDGASGDGTHEILKKESAGRSGLRFVSEPDHGIYDALNKGIAMATGDVIGFLHSDDLLETPGTLTGIASCFSKNAADGVYGDLVYVVPSDPSRIVRYWKGKPYNAKLLEAGWMPAHPTLFLKREVYEKYGGFDVSYRIAADYEFMLRILKDPAYRFTYLPKLLVRMRTGGASNRSLKNLLRKSAEDYRAMRNQGIPFPALTLARKNLSKITQFLHRPSAL